MSNQPQKKGASSRVGNFLGGCLAGLTLVGGVATYFIMPDFVAMLVRDANDANPDSPLTKVFTPGLARAGVTICLVLSPVMLIYSAVMRVRRERRR